MDPIDPTQWRANWLNDFSPYVGRDKTVAAEIEQVREELRRTLDGRIFEREGTAWYRQAYTEAFLFMYDTSFYDRETGRYRIDEVLDDGEREFGGYDIILLWQSYPRLGIDERNQIDYYRDMPGGLAGLRSLTDRAHQRGVRVFINYNPWDVGTRREAGAEPFTDPRGYRGSFADTGAPVVADAEALAEVIAAIGADGIFLDTMHSDNPGFMAPLGRANPNIVFNPEGVPPLDALSTISGSWLQRSAVAPPGLLTIRWLEPRFSFRAIDRISLDRRDFIHKAFFHGCGLVIWENIFGWWNPWSAADRALLRRAVWVLREHTEAFQDLDWQPYIATHQDGVYAHRWHAGDTTVHTLLNESGEPVHAPALTVPSTTADGRSLRHYDVWNSQALEPEESEDGHLLYLSLQPGEAGCVVSAPAEFSIRLPPGPANELKGNTRDRTRVTLEDVSLRPVEPSALVVDGETPEGMVEMPGGPYRFLVRHNNSTVMEGACYGGIDHLLDKNHPPQHLDTAPYWIDKTEVTNAAYREFLMGTHYLPHDLTNFLLHWQRAAGQEQEPWTWTIPSGKERHPVVWIDLDDARAYARWAGKRLPLEAEWQRAGGFSVWPWGDTFDPTLCNSGTNDTTPVDHYPGGISRFGVLDMAGNVWEWTESERTDGHTRYAIIRGGSYLKVEGSIWYNASGAQPNDCHEKILLMYPGLDRCSTIGFRCVKDVG
ncbi:MAG: SUMF1/EgtB/PvdO family nonheme iron enzyme [Chloroflexota bacterium]